MADTRRLDREAHESGADAGSKGHERCATRGRRGMPPITVPF